MKFLRNYLDKVKPNFEKGGKFEKLHSTFDAFETFLYVPDTVTHKGASIRDAMDLKRTMVVVIIALVPSLLFGMFNVGYQHSLATGVAASIFENFWFGFLKVMPIIIVSYGVGLGIEFIFAQIRHHEVNEGFLVSGMLIPLVMPVDVPLWIVAVATAFAVIIGKEVFGGTGMNIFNPALLTRAFIFFAYPTSISGNTIWIAGMTDGSAKVADGFSGATPLAIAPEAMSNGTTVDWSSMPVVDWFYGFMPGSIGETSTLAILIGAAILLATGIGSWRIMVSVFAGGLLTGLLFNLIGANTYMDMPAYYHLLIGGFAFGAVFMATDPVTASQTNCGKWIYGFLVGFFAVVIRVLNPGYPEGMMLAILFMNAMVPLIDHYVVQANISRRLKRAKQ
ncbi:Na(+)-translocating NADH-quinone reductase subunit B [Mucinivorans hirudinis]|uniref:Na(+)-translocating NADH-quinone reductase subunit B n=1 Tax=Mucinivorans hirudinis TaxID=1433126 RepID=A0A060RD41_9BACT|nr:Na(+)-translocating NADH-quinone reductase subunit B [Mucinivorans hirudinis]